MTEKELRKLKRRDFLQLLLAQSKEMSAVQARLDKTTAELEQLRTASEDLTAKLGERDELINELKGRLDSKDATIRALRQEIEDVKAIMRAIRWMGPEKGGSIAMAPQSLDEIFEAARGAITDAERQTRRRGRKAAKAAKKRSHEAGDPAKS